MDFMINKRKKQADKPDKTPESNFNPGTEDTPESETPNLEDTRRPEDEYFDK